LRNVSVLLCGDTQDLTTYILAMMCFQAYKINLLYWFLQLERTDEANALKARQVALRKQRLEQRAQQANQFVMPVEPDAQPMDQL